MKKFFVASYIFTVVLVCLFTSQATAQQKQQDKPSARIVYAQAKSDLFTASLKIGGREIGQVQVNLSNNEVRSIIVVFPNWETDGYKESPADLALGRDIREATLNPAKQTDGLAKSVIKMIAEAISKRISRQRK